MKKTKWLQFSLVTLSLVSATAQAGAMAQTGSAAYDMGRFSLNAAVGYLTGKSKEFVYDNSTDSKISQLNWKIDGAAVIQGEANYKILSWLDANAQGWVTLAKGAGTMDDYDWMSPGQSHWTDWSHHDDTDLQQANEFDLNLRAWFLQRPRVQLAGMIGYQRTLFNFLAKGGCFNYDNGTYVGCSPEGELGIGYQQTFSSPYIGLAGKYLINLFEFNGLFKFSNLVNARDVDQHYRRDLLFKEGSDHFKFYNATINAGYRVKPQIKLFAEGTFTYFPNKKTSTSMVNYVTGESQSLGMGSAGFSNRNFIFALGVQYSGMAS